jgi:hypothetical protein
VIGGVRRIDEAVARALFLGLYLSSRGGFLPLRFPARDRQHRVDCRDDVDNLDVLVLVHRFDVCLHYSRRQTVVVSLLFGQIRSLGFFPSASRISGRHWPCRITRLRGGYQILVAYK